MFLIVGLGNPEEKYAKTFHNLGFLAAGDCAAQLGVKFKKKECEASVAEGYLGGEKVIIARPLTYMNASGRAVKQLVKKYKVSPEELVVHAQRNARVDRLARLYAVRAYQDRDQGRGGERSHYRLRAFGNQKGRLRFVRVRVHARGGGGSALCKRRERGARNEQV